MQNLSNFYRLAVGTASDVAEAYKWAEIAAVLVDVNGSPKESRGAHRLYPALKRTLPETAVLEGDRRSQQWLAEHPIPAEKFLER